MKSNIVVKTPEQKWKNQIVALRKKCQEILSKSKSIRYVGVINEYGRTLTGFVKPDVRPLLRAEQVKNEFFIISTLMTLRKNSVSSIGQLDYVVLKHEKVTILIFQKNNLTFYISIDAKEKNLAKIIPTIKKLL